MVKSFFKELLIILLLLFAIITLLGVLFYNYMPNKETLPSKAEEYILADDIKVELEKEANNANSEEIIKTYQLDAIELEHYEKTKEYNKGKVNPFAQYSNGTTNNGTTPSTPGNGGNNGNGNSSNTTNNNETTNNNSSSGTFLNTVGK